MTTYTAIPAADVARLAQLAAAGDLDAIRELVAAHQQRSAAQAVAADAARHDAIAAAYRTARPIARAIIEAETAERAHQLAQQRPVRGRVLTALGDLLGVHLHGTVAERQRQLVDQSIGQALRMAAISVPARPDGQQDRDTIAARVNGWRARKLAQLDG